MTKGLVTNDGIDRQKGNDRLRKENRRSPHALNSPYSPRDLVYSLGAWKRRLQLLRED